MCVSGHVISPAAQAQSGVTAREISQGEWAVLPDWCFDTQGGPFGGPEGALGLNKSPRAGHWVSVMGSDFWHMHHYCWGLRDMLRMRGVIAAGDRRFLQGRAVSEFQYIIKNCSPSMPLMPEVYLKLGEVLMMQGDLPAASSAFERSRSLKADYWPAYTRWIDVLIGLKQFDQATALAREGLAHAPDSEALRERLKALQGKPRPARPEAAKGTRQPSQAEALPSK